MLIQRERKSARLSERYGERGGSAHEEVKCQKCSKERGRSGLAESVMFEAFHSVQ